MYTFTTKKKHYVSSPVEFMATKANSASFKEVKLFMTKPSDMLSTIEILISSSTLRPNVDYELHMMTAATLPGDEDPPAKEEDVIISSQKNEGQGVVMRIDDSDFGMSCLAYHNENNWY